MHIPDLLPLTEQRVVFKPGQPIFNEGEFGDFMYVLLEGTVEVLVHGQSVGAFEPVEVFGEMAIIDPRPRSASVVAKTTCKLVRVNRPRFLVLVENKPEFALYVMQMLVDRIRYMDSAASANSAGQAQQIAALQEEVKSLEAALESQKQEMGALQQTRRMAKA